MVVDLTSVLLVTRPLLHPQRSWRGPLGEASGRRPVLVQAGSHTMEGMKRKEQDEGLLERLNGQPDCGRGREAVLCVHWIFLLGIHVNGSNDCSRTELLSSGVTHFKFMLCRDLDFFSSSPAVWMSIPTQWTLTRLTIVPRHLPFGVLDCHSLLVIRLQAFFFSLLGIKNKDSK